MDDLSHSKLSLLLSMPLFSSLSSEHLERMALIAKEQVIDSGTMIYEQGDVGHSIYIIISGQLKVFRTSSSGLETLIAYRGPGDSIGEMALLTDEPRSTSVQTTEDSLLLIIVKEDFDQLLRDDPDLARVFIKVLMGHLRTSYTKIEHEISQEVALRDFLSEQHHPIEPKLIGTSRKMTALKKEVEDVTAIDDPTLITGEVGTEHATVAQLIHEKSHRKEEVFFIIDCAAIPTLMPLGESREAKERDFIVELSQGSAIFGHEAAVFPFAKSERPGYLAIAHSGTLVLENVEKLQKSVQENLAAYLRDGSFTPKGSNYAIQSDIRIIATSNADLAIAVEEGHFHKELYEQLSAQYISIPPLRERKRDMDALIEHFIDKYNAEAEKEVKGVTPEAINLIMRHDWPDNVEELASVIRRGVYIYHNMKCSLHKKYSSDCSH